MQAHIHKIVKIKSIKIVLKGTLHFFLLLTVDSFYDYPRVKELSFTVFGSFQPISGCTLGVA